MTKITKTVTYYNETDSATIYYFDDGFVEHTCTVGVSDEELITMDEANGSEIDGWESIVVL